MTLLVLCDFLVTVKATPHECVIMTGQAENEACFFFVFLQEKSDLGPHCLSMRLQIF